MARLPRLHGGGREAAGRRSHGAVYWLSLILGAAGLLGLQLLAAAAANWIALAFEG
jgi:hypothetical protein